MYSTKWKRSQKKLISAFFDKFLFKRKHIFDMCVIRHVNSDKNRTRDLLNWAFVTQQTFRLIKELKVSVRHFVWRAVRSVGPTCPARSVTKLGSARSSPTWPERGHSPISIYITYFQRTIFSNKIVFSIEYNDFLRTNI